MPKMLKQICRKLWHLSASKKWTSYLTSFLRYCKDIGNLLLWELWECLTIFIRNHSINLQETFMLICMQKTIFIPNFFLKLLQRNIKLVILSNLVMPCLWCLTAGKKSTTLFTFHLDIAKILQTCSFGYFGHA